MSGVNIDVISEWVQNFQAGTDHFLVEVKLSPAKLTVLIDKPTGITIDECVELNRFLQKQLEGTTFFDTHELEVGSPGIDQPLKVYKQYLRRIGSKIKVLTSEGTVHQGILKNADNSGIDLLEIKTERENNKKIKREVVNKFSFESIKETKLIFNF